METKHVLAILLGAILVGIGTYSTLTKLKTPDKQLSITTAICYMPEGRVVIEDIPSFKIHVESKYLELTKGDGKTIMIPQQFPCTFIGELK